MFNNLLKLEGVATVPNNNKHIVRHLITCSVELYTRFTLGVSLINTTDVFYLIVSFSSEFALIEPHILLVALKWKKVSR